MVGAEGQRRLDVHDGVAGDRARLHRLADALVDRLDVLLRDHAAGDLVVELVALAGVRLERDDGVAVLAAAAGLAHELALDLLDLLAHGLAVGDLRLADVRRDAELAHEAVDDDLEVQLAHAGDDDLAGLVVGAHAERRVLFREPRERLCELVLVGLRLGLDGQPDDGLGERDRLEQDLVRLVAQRVPGRDLLEADGGGDLAGAHGLALLAAVGVHLEDAPDALLAARGRVVDVRAGLEHAGVDPEVRQLADERVGHDLEGERAERLVEARLALELLAGLRVDAVHRALVERRGQVVDDRVEQRLDALVLERRAAQDGRDREVERAGADRGAQASRRRSPRPRGTPSRCRRRDPRRPR